MSSYTQAKDEHGQPIVRAFFGDRVMDRCIQEMLGFCRGLLADNVVNDEECRGFRRWLRAHPDVCVSFPGNVLAPRIDAIFEDGEVDEDERAELRDLMRDTVGEDDDEPNAGVRTTRLIFTEPPPAIVYSDRVFVLTGRFVFGARAKCESEITARGGRIEKNATGRTDYLVAGVYGSEAWLHSTHGLKIRDALDLAARGRKIAIVSEEHWVKSLNPA